MPEPKDVSLIDFNKLYLLRTNIIFYNWSENSNFPAPYGMGMAMPCPDNRFTFLFYTNGASLWVGTHRVDPDKFTWSKIG